MRLFLTPFTQYLFLEENVLFFFLLQDRVTLNISINCFNYLIISLSIYHWHIFFKKVPRKFLSGSIQYYSIVYHFSVFPNVCFRDIVEFFLHVYHLFSVCPLTENLLIQTKNRKIKKRISSIPMAYLTWRRHDIRSEVKQGRLPETSGSGPGIYIQRSACLAITGDGICIRMSEYIYPLTFSLHLYFGVWPKIFNSLISQIHRKLRRKDTKLRLYF